MSIPTTPQTEYTFRATRRLPFQTDWNTSGWTRERWPNRAETTPQVLDQLRRGVWLPDRVVNLALQYVTTAVGKSSTYKALKPQLDVIMFEIVFPLLCFNQEDAELWRDDPHDYVRKGKRVTPWDPAWVGFLESRHLKIKPFVAI
jgi:hypothetical protein